MEIKTQNRSDEIMPHIHCKIPKLCPILTRWAQHEYDIMVELDDTKIRWIVMQKGHVVSLEKIIKKCVVAHDLIV